MKELIFDSELKVLEILWEEGEMVAKDLTRRLKMSTDWQRTTSYTVIKKCIEKGFIERTEPNFVCRALITKKEARIQEIEKLTEKMFEGSSDLLIALLLGQDELSPRQVNLLRSMAEEFSASMSSSY